VEGFFTLRCAFFQHPHAFKTKSADHFKKILENEGFIITALGRDNFSSFNINDFDFVVLYQADHLIESFEDLEIPVIVVPMFDETLDRKASFFRHRRNFQYISFSKILHKFLTLNGNSSRYLQYWPEIDVLKNPKKEQVFFWERTPLHIDVEDVCHWFSKTNLKVMVRQHWDPNHLGSNKIAWSDRLVDVGSDWLDHSDFYKYLSESQVFISPRRWEGIGVSALEAMTLGTAVVGLDSPTLNEYVEHGKTGILIKNSNKNVVIGDYDWSLLGVQAQERAKFGLEKYKRESRKVLQNAIDQALQMSFRERLSIIPKNLTVRKFVYLHDFQR